MKLSLLIIVLACNLQTATAGGFAEIEGNLQQQSYSSSDWYMVDSNGNRQRLIGQVRVIGGYEFGHWSVFGGVNHLSYAEYGHDRGSNGLTAGIRYRVEF
jgi:hypothetical protein